MDTDKHGFGIRILGAEDAAAFRQLRGERLVSEPRAFGESPAEHEARPLESFRKKLAETKDDDFVLGAFDGDRLIGAAGFSRIQRVKRRHKGGVWGMFVIPEYRRRGIARALLEALLERVRKLPDLRLVELSVTVEPARKLYESLGFIAWGREPASLWLDGEFIDEDHMVLDLRQKA